MNARQIVIEEARRAGVDPAIALSIWEQESGGSTDTSVRGQTLPSGKWKGHYARGPWQIMSFHGDIPNDFQGQTRWAMQHLKERGVRGYYGEGSPVVPGHPTTDEYEASVRARAGRMNIDPRMASATPMGGVPPTDPNMLPDRGANQMTPVATPGFNPNDPYGHMIGAKHPMFDQVMGQQQREPSIWDMMTAFGAAGLNSQGGNWFGAGAKAVNDLMQESPGALTGLEALQANNELFELDERRRQAQMERRQQQRRNDALRQIAEDPNQPEWRRQQAQDAVMGLDGVFEAPKQPEAPTKIREAEMLSQRLGIPFEEAAARVGLQAPATEAPQDPTKVREAQILSERLGIPFEEAATRVGLQAPPAPETGLPAGINHSDITAVRKEFAATPEVREYNAAASQYGSLVNVLEDIDNPAANVAAIFNFMKSLDPTSVVRESEQGMVASASGPMRAFASMVNKSLSKGALTAKDRADIVEAARAALLSRHERVLKVYDRYGRIAREQFRMEDPYLVIGEQPEEPAVPMYASDMPPVEPQPVRPPSPGWGAAR